MEAANPQLRMLFDYTVFHIGLYTTLVSALFALMTFGHAHRRVMHTVCYLKVTVACFLVAGAAGGAIASNIPNYRDFGEFCGAELSVFGLPPLLQYSWLAHIEHGAFWVGIIIAAIGLLRE